MTVKIARDDNTAQDLRVAAGSARDGKGARRLLLWSWTARLARRPLRSAPWIGRRCVISECGAKIRVDKGGYSGHRFAMPCRSAFHARTKGCDPFIWAGLHRFCMHLLGWGKLSPQTG